MLRDRVQYVVKVRIESDQRIRVEVKETVEERKGHGAGSKTSPAFPRAGAAARIHVFVLPPLAALNQQRLTQTIVPRQASCELNLAMGTRGVRVHGPGLIQFV